MRDRKDSKGLRTALRESEGFDSLTALSLMIFFALCSQCMGTLAVIRRETQSWKWPIFTFTYMTVIAWLFSTAVFQIGRMIG
jgi:ferrous iron transport protein B